MKVLPRRDGSAVKRERIRKMHSMLKGVGDLSLERFLAICSYNIGLTERTAMKYLKDLEALDLIEIDETLNIVREVEKEVVEE